MNSTKILPSDTKSLGICGAIFSPNNYFMILQEDDGDLALWDVSSRTLPMKIWSSNTIPPESTIDTVTTTSIEKSTTDTVTTTSIVARSLTNNWSPAYHVASFSDGVKVQKSQFGRLTAIHAALTEQVLEPASKPNSYLVLRNDGSLHQVADGLSTPIASLQTAPLWAPIQLADGSSTRCVTVSASNLISFDLCNGRIETQKWMLRNNGQVFNQGTGLCLDVGAGSSARSNTCDWTKASQKWSWVNGYLQVTLNSGTHCLKAIPGTIDTSFSSAIGTCDGPLLAWNK
jgi:hypothetical protein